MSHWPLVQSIQNLDGFDCTLFVLWSIVIFLGIGFATDYLFGHKGMGPFWNAANAGIRKMYLGHSAEGFADVETALRLSPRAQGSVPWWQFYMCVLHAHLAHWDQAIEWREKSGRGHSSGLAPLYGLGGRQRLGRARQGGEGGGGPAGRVAAAS